MLCSTSILYSLGYGFQEWLWDNLLVEMWRVQHKAWELLVKTESEDGHRNAIWKDLSLNRQRGAAFSAGALAPLKTKR
jgi:hypothetical protein